MSSPYQVLIRTDRSQTAVEGELRDALRAAGGQVVVHRVDPEEASDAREFHAFTANLTAQVKLDRAGQEGAVFVALVSWARGRGVELLVLLDYEQVMLFRDGTLQPADSERQFFERQVIPNVSVPVSWLRPT